MIAARALAATFFVFFWINAQVFHRSYAEKNLSLTANVKKTFTDPPKKFMRASLFAFKLTLHYTRHNTPKRVTSCGAHLLGLAPGQHSSEETLQRWRVVGDPVPILPARKSNPRPTAPIACALLFTF